LGLAICKQLVELMGGVLGVTSRRGAGSTFWATLPLPLSEQFDTEPYPRRQLEGMRVLIGDCHEASTVALKEMIAGCGPRVDGFSNGKDVLKAMRGANAAGDPYHLALLYCQLPDMAGETLVQAIKTDPALAHTTIVMLMDKGSQSETKRLEETYCAASLTRPILPSSVFDLLNAVGETREKIGSSLSKLNRIARNRSLLAQGRI
jgi:DNA-binding response OmpR family regulator